MTANLSSIFRGSPGVLTDCLCPSSNGHGRSLCHSFYGSWKFYPGPSFSSMRADRSCKRSLPAAASGPSSARAGQARFEPYLIATTRTILWRHPSRSPKHPREDRGGGALSGCREGGMHSSRTPPTVHIFHGSSRLGVIATGKAGCLAVTGPGV